MPGPRSKSTRFMEREIEVEGAEDAPRRPVAFKVGGHRYVVAAVLSTWEDEEPGGRTRRQRRHRTFYRLRTEKNSRLLREVSLLKQASFSLIGVNSNRIYYFEGVFSFCA